MNAARLRAVRRAGLAAAAAAAVLLIAAGLFWLQWDQDGRQAMPDSYWYTRQAVTYAGAGAPQAAAAASAIECASRNGYAREVGMRPHCHHYPAGQPNPRYVQIFTTRPGFSLLAAPLVRLGGAWRGMMQATALAALLGALALYAAVRALGGSRIAGIASPVLLFLLPSGYWITRMLPEGAMLAGCLVTGVGATMLWPRDGAGDGASGAPGRGRMIGGLALAAAGLVCTYAIKSANGFLLSAVLLAGGAGLAGWKRLRAPGAVSWPTAWAVTAVGAAGTVGWLIVSTAAHLPSFTDTIQDMASRHFRGRLTPSPVMYLLRRDAWFLPHWCLVVLQDKWWLPLVAAGVAALVWTCRYRAVPLLLIGVTGPLAVAAHPIGSEADRLVLPVWLPVITGLVLGAERAGRQVIIRWTARHRSGPPGARPEDQTVAGRSPARPPADSVPSPPARS